MSAAASLQRKNLRVVALAGDRAVIANKEQSILYVSIQHCGGDGAGIAYALTEAD
ncbi:MAG: hypothetical protein M3319_13880 [Actinomycetota bacterium]|nr:hypothetical protein [Actinomycetota bacterium]